MAKKVVKNPKSRSSKTSRSNKSSKSAKKDNAWVWSVVALSILVIILAAAVLSRLPLNNSNYVSGNVISGNPVLSNYPVFSGSGSGLDQPIQNPVVSWITGFLNLGSTFKQVVISLILLAILGAGLYDIISLTSIFNSEPVKIIIAVGLALIGTLVGLVNKISVAAIAFAATLGTIGIILEIIISIIIFIGLSVGSVWIAKFALKRKYLRDEVDANIGAKEAGAAVNELKDIFRAFKKKIK